MHALHLGLHAERSGHHYHPLFSLSLPPPPLVCLLLYQKGFSFDSEILNATLSYNGDILGADVDISQKGLS